MIICSFFKCLSKFLSSKKEKNKLCFEKIVFLLS